MLKDQSRSMSLQDNFFVAPPKPSSLIKVIIVKVNKE